ncbi:MAG: nuclear transport factor 2 family protein [Polyangiaceae bacterium]
MTTENTLELVRAYYDSWQGGSERFDEAWLRKVLHPSVVFESPMGRKDKIEDLLTGVARFNQTMNSRRLLQLFAVGNEAAAIYDCELAPPINHLRCAEFFRVEGAQITAIRLVFDATPYRAKP